MSLFYRVVLTAWAVTGCASQQVTPCTDPRPQICTAIYMPVCGVDSNGTVKTYASDCSACAHQEVISYTPGACNADQ